MPASDGGDELPAALRLGGRMMPPSFAVIIYGQPFSFAQEWRKAAVFLRQAESPKAASTQRDSPWSIIRKSSVAVPQQSAPELS